MSAPTYDLGTLHGGLRLDAHKRDSTGMPLQMVPVPEQMVLPLDQHVGAAATPVVAPGDRVLRGQLIARQSGAIGAAVHASTSGTVVAIEPRPVARRHGDPAPCIVLESDGEDRAIEPARASSPPAATGGEPLAARILEGGIVGLGGAVFPTAAKLAEARSAGLDTLILNGVECEPWISCDDTLMRERADAIVAGGRLLLEVLGIDTACVAVESDKPEALDALAAALGRSGDDRFRLKQVPTIYPSGAEDQLVQLVANREVPSGGLPTDAGCLVQNVGTAAAVYDWIERGEPLISRITTVTGPGVAKPTNVLVRVGTPVADVIAFAGGYTDAARHLVIGGSMTGKSMSTDRVPVVKATNCILVLGEARRNGPVRACIRCGECAAVCPIRLLPQQLHWFTAADDESALREHGLLDCIECGCCDLVCPSHLPLTTTFRTAKARIRELEDEKARARRARRRFEARRERLAREEETLTADLDRQKRVAKSAGKDAIAEIMRRKRGQDDD